MSKPQDSSSSSTSSSETSSQSPPPPLPPPKSAPPLTSDSSSSDDSDDDVGGDEKEESQPVRVQDPGPSVPSKKRVHGGENGKDEAKKLKVPVEKKSSSSTSSSETSSQSPPPPLPPPKSAPPLISDSSSSDDSDDDVGGDEKEESQPVRVQDPGPSVPSKKRVHGGENGKDEAKKLKVPVEKKSSQTPLFIRVFTEEDEVALMRGLVDFCAKKGVNAVSVLKNKALFDSFHASVGRLLHVNVTGKQMKNKIRRMKGRRVKDPALSDMWGRLWKDEKVDTVSENGNGVKDVKVVPEEGMELPPFLDVSVEVCCRDGKTLLGEGVFRKNLTLLGKEEVGYLEKKWMKLWELDVKLSQKRNELETRKNKLINIELRMISEALTRSANQ